MLAALFVLFKCGGINMAYKTNKIRGNLIDPVTFHNEIGGEDLYEKIKDAILTEIYIGNLSATTSEDILKSGGMFGTKVPMFIIKNPLPENKFFDIGICVNGKTMSFPLLGESAENTKNNKKEYYFETGSRLKAKMIKVDEFKLQQEIEWQQTIINCLGNYIDID